jgi:O-antigen/teichoic acid export membrane protein
MSAPTRIGRPLARLKCAIGDDPAMTGAILALAIKGGGAVLMIVVFTLAARALPAPAFGEIAIWFNVLSCLAVAAAFGQENLIVRSWAEYASGRRFGLMAGAYRFGWLASAAATIAACLGLVVVNRFIAAPLGSTALGTAVAFLAAQAMLHYSSHSCRTIHGFRMSEINRELTWRVVLLIVVALDLHGDLSLAIFFSAAAAGMALSIAVQCVATSRAFPGEVARARPIFAWRAWFERGRRMCLSASVEAMGQYADVVLLGLLVAPAEAAKYFIAARIANVFAMISTGLNTYTVTHAGSLHFAGETDGLQKILRSVMMVVVVLGAPLLLVLAAAASPILSVFGRAYAAGCAPLVILATASFAITLCGPASGILVVTGEERLWSRIALLSLALRLLLILYLAPRWGAAGAAFGWAIVSAPMMIGVSFLCRKRCGVDASALSILPSRRTAPRPVAARPASDAWQPPGLRRDSRPAAPSPRSARGRPC